MNHDELKENLRQQNAIEVYAWICRVREGVEHIPDDFDWLNFAAFYSLKAQYSVPDKQSALDWAKVAIASYHYIIEHSSKKQPHLILSLESDVMWLRSFLIRKFGAVVYDPILDVNDLVSWFFRNLPFSPEMAEAKTLELKKLMHEKKTQLHQDILEEMRSIRHIKNSLSIMQSLRDEHLLTSEAELDKWLSIRDKLL